MKVAASNINIKMHQLFSEQRILGVCLRDRSTAENLCGLHSNLLLNNVQTILVKITIKLILIFLSNSFFNFFMKIKNEKWTAFRFPFFYENEKRMRVLKIQSKTLLNMKMVVKYLNFVFHIEAKTKSNYKILNFVFQFMKNTKWHFRYTTSIAPYDSPESNFDIKIIGYFKRTILLIFRFIKNFIMVTFISNLSLTFVK